MRGVKKLARFCGPAAIAAASDFTREEAAVMIKMLEPRKRQSTNISSIGKILKRPVTYVPRWNRLTVNQWLREDGRDAVIRAAHHFMVVKNGRVVEDNGYRVKRGYVTHIILLH